MSSENELPIFQVTFGAVVESFYRAGMNGYLNRYLNSTFNPLTSSKQSIIESLFPNMKVQIPSRIVYLNGLKQIRFYLENNVDPNKSNHPLLIKMAINIAPGLIMTPMSSILEACHVSNTNPKPLYYRALDGITFRSIREICFGIGINRLTDYCNDELCPSTITNSTGRIMLGSLMAGGISGYISHIPHNLSTLKLMFPDVSYYTHFKTLQKNRNIPSFIPSNWHTKYKLFATLVFPTGVIIRTTQIAGSFIILNTIVYLMN